MSNEKERHELELRKVVDKKLIGDMGLILEECADNSVIIYDKGYQGSLKFCSAMKSN